jgi:hypothetical protein
MAASRIRMRDVYGETPPNVYSDFDWIRRHEKELLEQYGERSIIVYREQVIGVGDSYTEALEDAEHNLPPDIAKITPVHQQLRDRYRLIRFQFKAKVVGK